MKSLIRLLIYSWICIGCLVAYSQYASYMHNKVLEVALQQERQIEYLEYQNQILQNLIGENITIEIIPVKPKPQPVF